MDWLEQGSSHKRAASNTSGAGESQVSKKPKVDPGVSDFKAISGGSALPRLCSGWNSFLSDNASNASRFVDRYAEFLDIGPGDFDIWSRQNGPRLVRILLACHEKSSFRPLLDEFVRAGIYNEATRLPPSLQTQIPIKMSDDAIKKAWKVEYRGRTQHRLLQSILQDDRSAPYANSGAIIQSSGYGKSRTVDEMADLVTTIPINVRSVEDSHRGAYPPADEPLCTFFQETLKRNNWKDIDDATDSIHGFFWALFRLMAEEMRDFKKIKYPNGAPHDSSFASEWKKHLAAEGRRKSIYQTLNETFKDGKSPIPFDAAEAEAKRALSDILDIIPFQVFQDSPRPLKLLLYVDEAHTLAELKIPQSHLNVYDMMLRAVASYSEYAFFVLCLSTASHAGTLAGPVTKARSDRMIAATDTLIAPYTEMPFDCHPDLEKELIPGSINLNDVQDFRFMLKFGRPLFWTLFDANSASEDKIVDFAAYKLTLQSSWSEKLTSSTAKLAVLDVLLSLDYHPMRANTMNLMQTMVAGHMRTAFSVHKSRTYLYSGYPSEPILAEGAIRVIRQRDLSTYDMGQSDTMVELFDTLDDDHSDAVDRGQRGENVSKMILLRAYLNAVKADESTVRKGCSAPSFLKALLAERFHANILRCRPDNVAGGQRLDEAFKDGWIRFTHFVRAADDTGITTNAGWVAYTRSAAIIGWHSQEEVDFYVPVHLHKDKPIAEEFMTGILAQNKLRMRKGSVAAYAIDAERISFFPPYDSATRGADILPQPYPLRPYIAIVMELGVTIKPDPAALTRAVGVARAADKGLPLQPPAPRKKTKAQPQVTPSKVRTIEGSSRSPKPRRQTDVTRHPRYSIFIYGCSPTVYAGIHECDRVNYRRLLRIGDVLTDHPRKHNLDLVRRMKPFWSAGLAYSWVADTFLHGGSTSEPEVEDDVVIGADIGDDDSAEV